MSDASSSALSREQQIQEQFGRRAPIYEERAAWIPAPSILQAYVSLCRAPRDGALLDVCCGTGIVGGAFRGRMARLVGLDLTAEMLEKARARLDEVQQGKAEHLPFADGTFDCVVIRQALHFVDSPAGVVAEMARVAKPGGQVIVGHRVPYGSEDAGWWEAINRLKQPLIKNLLVAEDLHDFVKAAGLREVDAVDVYVEESIQLWVNSPEASAEGQKILQLYQQTPPEVRALRGIEISPTEVRDRWRWHVVSAIKPE